MGIFKRVIGFVLFVAAAIFTLTDILLDSMLALKYYNHADIFKYAFGFFVATLSFMVLGVGTRDVEAVNFHAASTAYAVQLKF